MTRTPRFAQRSIVDAQRVSESAAFEKHYSPKELADIWGLDVSTVRKMLRDEPGVVKFESAGRRGKRTYCTLRIPESVAERIHARRSG